MTSEQWSRAKTILLAAAAHRPEQRDGYLALACAHDHVLAAELGALLTTSGPTLGPALDRPPDHRRETWGDFRLLDEVGRGGFGRVYRAFDHALRREVALKVITVPLSAPATTEALLREGQMLARVRHPNVATVFGARHIGADVGIWMEFVEGRTLSDIVQRDGPLAVAEVSLIGISLCGALSAVHAVGLVHGDVKAQNVMRDDTGRVVLLDFGAGQGRDEWSRDEIIGTPIYMAPEVLRGQAATTGSDVYSAGVLLFYLLTGQYPVSKTTFRDAFAPHGEGARLRLAECRSGLPSLFVRAIECALSPNPRDRFATAVQFLDALTASSEAERAIRRLDRRRRVQRIALWAATATVAVTLMGLYSSMVVNATLGRYGPFAAENPFDWLLWGGRSLIAPGILVSMLLCSWSIVRWIFRLVRGLAPRLGTSAARIRSASVPLLTLLGFYDANGMATAMVAFGALAFAWTFWWYSDIWAAVFTHVTSETAARLRPLQPSNVAAHNYLRMTMVVINFLIALGLARVVRLRRAQPQRPGARSLIVSLLVLVIGLLVLTTPWRVLSHSSFERIDVSGSRCYAIGRDGNQLLVYCPEAEPPRNKVVMASEPNVRPTGIVESMFTPP